MGDPSVQYARDSAMSALILGSFASCWFGWAPSAEAVSTSPRGVCLVVGVHFWPMAPVLQSPSLMALGALLTVVAVVAVLVSRTTAVAASAVTGAGAGPALLGFASRAAVSAIA
jgi:hypothetical protein